ncbi:type II secretion system F family protein [Methylobacillus flagellatus]|uniref:Type II secretion system protein n=1 Tax=Methylobacillus flagellatus (strain ATCC 51484 / DSM 6875 / VKM B-1610 / KT) TaxID=265072 RepID=Q1GXE0_METFK|nr:type II secretion system F family protein [Methylobacillus flagellatus]ABE48350.1 type II secretion system protein [Methylobacillus flagellatus KT]
MPTFNYKAVDQTGKAAHGQIDALNEIDLELRLKRVGLDLITFRPSSLRPSILSRSKVSLQDLVIFCFQLEQLTSAGVPLLEGLVDLRDSTTNPHFQKIIGSLVSSVEGGKMLSQALAEYPYVFNRVFVSLIKAGEQTGRLPEIFRHLADTLKWQDELISQTRKLLAYPTFVLVVVVAAVIFLMAYLVPQMVSFLGNIGQALPLQTRILIAVSNAVVGYWWLILGLPLLIATIFGIAIHRNPDVRYRYDFIKLHLPVTGNILNKIILARFSRYFALMYQTGIPVLDGIRSCEEVVDNLVVAEALNRAWQQINAGESMSDSFRNVGLFPPLVVRMIRVGESTGALDKALLNVSYFYDRDVNESVEKLLKMIEPALTVILGAILALIMFSVLGPVYDSFSQLKL